jgi:hypothetical protein
MQYAVLSLLYIIYIYIYIYILYLYAQPERATSSSYCIYARPKHTTTARSSGYQDRLQTAGGDSAATANIKTGSRQCNAYLRRSRSVPPSAPPFALSGTITSVPAIHAKFKTNPRVKRELDATAGTSTRRNTMQSLHACLLHAQPATCQIEGEHEIKCNTAPSVS